MIVMGLGWVCVIGKDFCIWFWLIWGIDCDYFCVKEVVKYLVIYFIFSKLLIIVLCLFLGCYDSDVFDDICSI